MKHVIVYWSRYGNGKRVVDQLCASLREMGDKAIAMTTDQADPSAMPEADIYVFSAPTEMMGVQKNMKKFMKRIKGMDGRRYGLINTHIREGKNSLSKMEQMLTKKTMRKVAGVDLQVGNDAKNGNALPAGWQKEVEGFAEKLYRVSRA